MTAPRMTLIQWNRIILLHRYSIIVGYRQNNDGDRKQQIQVQEDTFIRAYILMHIYNNYINNINPKGIL